MSFGDEFKFFFVASLDNENVSPADVKGI